MISTRDSCTTKVIPSSVTLRTADQEGPRDQIVMTTTTNTTVTSTMMIFTATWRNMKTKFVHQGETVSSMLGELGNTGSQKFGIFNQEVRRFILQVLVPFGTSNRHFPSGFFHVRASEHG